MRARQSIRGVTPADEPKRRDPEVVAGRQQAQDQIVILGPTLVAVTEPAQHRGADHQRRVRDRAFDEGLFAHSPRRVDAVEPALVFDTPVRQRSTRKQAHVTAHRRPPAALERLDLDGQALAMHEIVRIHARDEGCTAALQAGVQRSDDALGRRDDNGEALIAVRKRLGALHGRVGGPVVDDDTLPPRLALPLDAAQTCRQGRRRIERRQEDRNERPVRHRELSHNLSAATRPSTSLQPSSIIEARASRRSFSIGYSRLRPLPPKICNAALATSKAVWVAVTFDATA